MYVVRIIRFVAGPIVQEGDEWPVQPGQEQVSGTQHWLITKLVPPPPFTNDEVLPNATNFGLEDEFDASILLRRIEQSLTPVGLLDDADGLFYVSVDDDSLPPMAFMRQWLFKHPTAPILDDDPWTPFSTLGFEDELVLLFPPLVYSTAPAILDDEVLPNAINIGVDEEYWSPIFTMTIVNVMQPVATLDTEWWIVFVPPPPSVAKGLPLLGAGA